MKISKFLLLSIFLTTAANAQTYQEDWDDLDRYPEATWLNELKFGMYWHWNFNSVAGISGWYGRNMYNPRGSVYEHHKQTHGDQAVFGYKDFESHFTAEKFDASQWVEDAQRMGAKFIVGMAVHHDGFDMYDSSHTEWNSVDKNPHIDVLGELATEARKRGMKFGATSHLAWNWHFFSRYMYPDKYDAASAPKLYNIHPPDDGPRPEFVENWYARTTELIDKYELDFLWFDFGTGHEKFYREHTRKLTAHYFNKSVEWNKTVALATKEGFENRKSQVYDAEHGKFGYIRYPLWMSDCTFNNKWFNLQQVETHERISGQFWIYQLLDMVSKNGTLLLNLGPNADGSWPEPWKNELFEIGDWLEINDEAIYSTKPWHRYGEGPTHDGNGERHFLGRNLTADDIRFTRTSDALYATVCGWRDEPIDIRSLGLNDLASSRIDRVTLLGADEPIRWQHTQDALTIHFPAEKPCDFAYVYKIEGQGLFPDRENEYPFVQMHFAEEPTVSSIRISLPGEDNQLSISEVVFITDKRKWGSSQNVADLGQVSQSSTLNGQNANRAIDLNKSGHPTLGSMAETKISSNPWLLLKLDKPRPLHRFDVFAGMTNHKLLFAEGIIELMDVDGKVVYSDTIAEAVKLPEPKGH